jgi:mRNA interferase MazF
MRRGEIRLVDLGTARGSEADKRRPAVIVSSDRANASAQRLGRGVVAVVPVTSNTARVFPFQVLLPADHTGLRVDSKAQAEQVRSVAVGRLGPALGRLPPGSSSSSRRLSVSTSTCSPGRSRRGGGLPGQLPDRGAPTPELLRLEGKRLGQGESPWRRRGRGQVRGQPVPEPGCRVNSTRRSSPCPDRGQGVRRVADRSSAMHPTQRALPEPAQNRAPV